MNKKEKFANDNIRVKLNIYAGRDLTSLRGDAELFIDVYDGASAKAQKETWLKWRRRSVN